MADGQWSKLGWVPAGTASGPVPQFIRCRDVALWGGLFPMREERLILNARRDPVAEAAAALAAEIRAEVQASGAGVRIVKCQLLTKSPPRHTRQGGLILHSAKIPMKTRRQNA